MRVVGDAGRCRQLGGRVEVGLGEGRGGLNGRVVGADELVKFDDDRAQLGTQSLFGGCGLLFDLREAADGTGTAVARSTVPPDGTTMPHVSDVIVGAATVTVYEPITWSMPGSSVATNQTPGWPDLVTNTPFSSVAATTGSKKMVTGGSADAFLACVTLARNVTVAPGIGTPSGDSSPSEPSNTARIRRPVTRPYWTPLGMLMVYF